jgi:hypothetical protein
VAECGKNALQPPLSLIPSHSALDPYVLEVSFLLDHSRVAGALTSAFCNMAMPCAYGGQQDARLEPRYIGIHVFTRPAQTNGTSLRHRHATKTLQGKDMRLHPHRNLKTSPRFGQARTRSPKQCPSKSPAPDMTRLFENVRPAGYSQNMCPCCAKRTKVYSHPLYPHTRTHRWIYRKSTYQIRPLSPPLSYLINRVNSCTKYSIPSPFTASLLVTCTLECPASLPEVPRRKDVQSGTLGSSG